MRPFILCTTSSYRPVFCPCSVKSDCEIKDQTSTDLSNSGLPMTTAYLLQLLCCNPESRECQTGVSSLFDMKTSLFTFAFPV